MDARMNELLSQSPGYLGVKAYTADDGETVAIAQFGSHEALLRWRDHPEPPMANGAMASGERLRLNHARFVSLLAFSASAAV